MTPSGTTLPDDLCEGCVDTNGLPAFSDIGTPKWCRCCAANCANFRIDCERSGFCESECFDEPVANCSAPGTSLFGTTLSSASTLDTGAIGSTTSGANAEPVDEGEGAGVRDPSLAAPSPDGIDDILLGFIEDTRVFAEDQFENNLLVAVAAVASCCIVCCVSIVACCCLIRRKEKKNDDLVLSLYEEADIAISPPVSMMTYNGDPEIGDTMLA